MSICKVGIIIAHRESSIVLNSVAIKDINATGVSVSGGDTLSDIDRLFSGISEPVVEAFDSASLCVAGKTLSTTRNHWRFSFAEMLIGL
jgi:hypothetical protein